jgi:hypothetical protein
MLNIVTGSGNHVSVEIAFKVRQTGDPAKTAQLRRLDAVIFSQAVFSQPKYMKSKKSTILARAPPSLSSFFFLRSARPEQARTWQEKKRKRGRGQALTLRAELCWRRCAFTPFFSLG